MTATSSATWSEKAVPSAAIADREQWQLGEGEDTFCFHLVIPQNFGSAQHGEGCSVYYRNDVLVNSTVALLSPAAEASKMMGPALESFV